MMIAAGCSASDGTTVQSFEPTPEQIEALATSLTTFDAGVIADLDPSGVTEVHTPRDSVIVGTTAPDLRVFRQKDPNNGCRLQVVGSEFHDPCHGHSYRLDGTHTDPACERSLYEYDVEIVSEHIIVSLADGNPNGDVPICRSPYAAEH